MRQQFLYGRKSAGYCQLNQDDYIASGDDLLRLATLQNYIPVDGMNLDDLPLEYYAYTDEIDGARVWIEGLTSFVPGGTSAESGFRDTSMVHKYIYSGEDFKRHIGAEEEAETERKTRRFYCTVEDYRQGTGKNIEPNEGSEIKFSDLEKEFGFDGDDGGEKLADFIVCCLDAFSKPERRVYCYLPSADRKGSLCAKSLMETLLKVLPSCVNTGAGFITYSQNFHNASTNPIPGNISVIFIPDTFNNRQWEVSERNKSYIFDFKDYEKQNKFKLECYEHIKSFVNALINDMRIGRKDKTLSHYSVLMFFVKYDAVIDADFLSSFYLFKNLKNRVNNAEDKKETYYGKIGDTIGELLESEEFLTKEGKDRISQDVKYLLEHCQYTETDLEWIDNIYKSGELCRNQILYHLCDACLQFAKEPSHDQNEEILTITNFDYSDADLIDSILEKIYTEDKYFPVGQRLIFETLNPLRKSTKKTASEKRALLMSSVAALYNKYRYHEFVTSDYCKIEISDFLADCMQEAHRIDDMQKEMSAVSEAIGKMDRAFQEAYRPVLRKLSYLVVQEFVKSMRSQDQPVGGLELVYCEDLLNRYDLVSYEKAKETETSYVEKLKKAIRENELKQALGSGDVINSRDLKKVLEAFGQYPFEDAVAACDNNTFRVKKFLEAFVNYGYGDVQELEDWKGLFLYFCCMKDSDYVMELWGKCMLCIKQMEGLTGCIEFHKRMEEEINRRGRGRKEWKHPVLQELAYLIVKEFVSSGQTGSDSVLKDCKDLLHKYDLEIYEREEKHEASYAKNLNKIIRTNQLQQALVSGEVKEILEGFGGLPRFESAVMFCEDNYDRVKECIKKYEFKLPVVKEDQYHSEDWKELFCYFCCMRDSEDIMEKCLSLVMKKEGSLGLDKFCRNLRYRRQGLDISEKDKKRMEKKEEAIIQKIKKQYNGFENRQTLGKSEQRIFTRIGVKRKKDIEKKSIFHN